MCHGECDVIIADNQSLVAPTEFLERALTERLPELCKLFDVLVKRLILFLSIAAGAYRVREGATARLRPLQERLLSPAHQVDGHSLSVRARVHTGRALPVWALSMCLVPCICALCLHMQGTDSRKPVPGIWGVAATTSLTLNVDPIS